MDTQLNSNSATTSAPAAPERGLCVVWPRSVQITLGVLLVAGLFAVAGKALLQSIQAGPSTLPSQRIDINSATLAELLLLPGVGDNLAERIVQVRAKAPFRKIEDLRKVPGIGPATFERLRGWVFVALEPRSPIPPSGLPITVEPSKRPGAKPKKGTGLTEAINVNSAAADELQRIPGIGPKLSARIVDERARKPFETVAELRRVYGIGPKILEKIKPFVTVGSVK